MVIIYYMCLLIRQHLVLKMAKAITKGIYLAGLSYNHAASITTTFNWNFEEEKVHDNNL